MSKPYVPQPTKTRFVVPNTLAADFSEFLDNDIPNAVMTFTGYHDWSDSTEVPFTFRGELYPDTTKSRYENTDNNMNLNADIAAEIKKGDIVSDENNILYLLDWGITKLPNALSTRALKCNLLLTVKRYQNEVVDSLGYVTTEGSDVTIVDQVPCNAYRYDGRPEYSLGDTSPGVIPNALTLLSIQFNAATKLLIIGDKFMWGNEEYIIVDIDRVGVDLSEQFGVIKLQARKAPGGIHE